MRELVAQAWNPWIAWLVLGVGLVLLLATVLVPLRGLPQAIAALRRRTVSEGSREAAGRRGDGPLWLALATATGMGGITGGVLAVELAGPGALVWMWIATILGMGIAFAEGSLSARAPRPKTQPDAPEEPATIHLLQVPRVGKLLAPMYALAVVVLALVLGAAFQTNQAAAVLDSTVGIAPRSAAIGLAAAAAPFVLLPRLRRLLLLLVPVVMLLYVVAALAALGGGDGLLGLAVGDAINQAFGIAPVAGGAAGGGVGLLMAHGVLRATMIGEAGLGSAALLDLRSSSRGKAGAVIMLVPLLAAGLVGSLSGLLMLDASAKGEPVAEAKLIPLEHSYFHGGYPSQQVGQTVVLAEDTDLERGKYYAMRLRGSPRGHALAKLVVPKDNPNLSEEDRDKPPHVVLPHWGIAQHSDTVVFRARDPERAKQPGWDVRVPCTREVKKYPGSEDEYIVLRPVDPELDMRAMAVRLDLLSEPYVVFDDFDFVGYVGEATNPSLGRHLAMFEPPNADRAFNPPLHLFFRGDRRFGGPYVASDSPRPPWGMVAREGFTPEIGTVVDLRIEANPRGDAVVALTRSGSVEAPPWDMLLESGPLVLQHDSDPARDIRIPVTPRYDDHRIRFEIDMWGIERIPGFVGPYLVVPQAAFEAEMAGEPAPAPAPDDKRAALLSLKALQQELGPFDQGKPPPSFVMDAKRVVLRNKDDSSQDLHLPVVPTFEDGKVRLDADLRFVSKLDHYAGPFLVVPDYDFQAEVHGDARLEPELAGRRVLVPLHPLGEMQGPFGEGNTYRPHPGELFAAGMAAPVLAQEGAQIVAARFAFELGGFGRFSMLLAVLVFALSTIVGWTELGGRAASAVAGSLGAPALRLAMLAAAAVGTSWTLAELLPLVDLVIAAVLLPNLLGLLLLVPRIRAAARMEDDLSEPDGEG
ncbi:MAG: alanine:cation symporter family protein [Myxococcales bacterium]|nr:alanine:cation symporter family protein [Myxococcales bacterium]